MDKVVIYPYIDGELISGEIFEKKYNKTWEYLSAHKKRLEARGSMASGDHPWWRPSRPREPKNLLRKKVVCPHLMLTSRFAVDLKGDIGVSHSPFIVIKDSGIDEEAVLKYFCAILNSSVVSWYISRFSYRYGRGYSRVEVQGLKDIPIPNPSRINSIIFRKIIKMVDLIILNKGDNLLEEKIDNIICNLYGLNQIEIRTVTGAE